MNLKYPYILVLLLCFACSNGADQDSTAVAIDDNKSNTDDEQGSGVVYAAINFSNWKVTLPVDENNNGKPDEYQPNVLMDFGYQALEAVKPYMYDDIEDSSLVFYTFPDVSTTNSSYSRTELRELINPSNSRENWSLLKGGEMKGRLKVGDVSENTQSNDDYHKVIVMQIHGIISLEDMATHGFSSNNGPPLIKIYWKDGYVWCHKKSLKDESTNGDDLLESAEF